MSGGVPVKRLISLLCVFLLLLGCGRQQDIFSQDYTPALSASSLPVDPSAPSFHGIYGNGSVQVGVVYGSQESPDTYYRLLLQDGTVSAQPFGSSQELSQSLVLGLDGEDGFWSQGNDTQGRTVARRLDLEGNCLQTIDFGPGLAQAALSGFSYDQDNYYFLVTGRECSWLMIFDHSGTERFRRSLSDYSTDTTGYLPREADWMEELEGRKGDRLMEMIFPDGPANTFGLFRTPEGRVNMMIRRQSPIDSETYGILCTLESDWSKAVPRYYYEIVTANSIQPNTFLESTDPAYDLLVATTQGIEGIRIATGRQTLLLTWKDALDYPCANFYEATPSVSRCSCAGPDGTWWLYGWNGATESFDITVLTPEF